MASAESTSVIYIFRALTEGTVLTTIASAERLLVSTCFVMNRYHLLLVSHPTKTNTYTALQNENDVSSSTIIVKKN
jgi:hypothetical protein